MTQAQILKALATALTAGATTPIKAQKRGKRGKAKRGAAPLSEAEKAAFMANNDAECVKVFTKAGYTDVQPRVNVLTYNKWIEKGRKVKKGEKSVRVNGFALFHANQTEALPAAPAVTADTATANTQPA